MSLTAVPSLRAATTAVIVLAAVARPASAQTPADSARRPCAYDLCAYRLERGRVLQGRAGVVVLSPGIFRAPADEATWNSDSARAHAARFSRRYAVARGVKSVSLLGTTVALLSVGNASRDLFGRGQREEAPYFVLAMGAAAFYVGHRIEDAARTELTRAIWWHNRELGR